MERLPRTLDRVSGLDSIRFVCAIWVALSHNSAPPLTDGLSRDTHLGIVLRGLYGNIWNGQAAVIVFFVISGFCIHYPFAGTDKRPALAGFYARRFLRLLVPAVVAIPLSKAMGTTLHLFHETVLWSLLSEFIYYVLYPLLRVAQLRAGSWKPLLLAAYAASLVILLTNPSGGDYPSNGPSLTWLVGLPCWLLGCVLAESVRGQNPDTAPVVSRGEMWAWRAGIFAAAWVASALRFHSPVGYPWTLNLFVLAATAWLRREINYRRTTPPVRWLEWAGLWSYSLYLLHPAVINFFNRRGPAFPLGGVHWTMMFLFLLAFSYGFYLLVERPGHALARRVSRSLRSGAPAAT